MEEVTLALPIGEQQLREFVRVLERYSAGRKKTADRILSAENWWRMRNTQEAAKEVSTDSSFRSQSGWLHNVITSKHADAMDAFPKAMILPREEADLPEARTLEQILPCILEENRFEETYSDAMWQKCKTGTGAYKILWDPNKQGGLGDIQISCVNLLNLYWQPEIRDIQKSRYFFHTELIDREVLEKAYPFVKGKLKGKGFVTTKFSGDEQETGTDQITVIEVYYHKEVAGKQTLQYCKFAGDQVLFATENQLEPQLDELGNVVKEPMALTGLYDHGCYPYVFDTLFPVEGSPCGYGYVDICKNPQITIDLLKTSFVRNARVGASPRYFSRLDGNVQEGEFLDLTKPIVHVGGNLDDATLRPVDYNPLSPVYVNVLQDTVQELRETSGNTETSTGNVNSGVTAAAAIAALQRASGKGSRDASRGSYRAFSRIVTMCVELIRQFYDLPRKFRILGEDGSQQFISYSNEHLKTQVLEEAYGEPMGLRKPVFDLKILAMQKNDYSAMAQNELALQLYQLGMFNPRMADQALMCLDMMEFEGKDVLVRRITENVRKDAKLYEYMDLSMNLAREPELKETIARDMAELEVNL